jgi:hypothetical protein
MLLSFGSEMIIITEPNTPTMASSSSFYPSSFFCAITITATQNALI